MFVVVAMLRSTFLSLRQSQNISQPRGCHSSLTCTSWSAHSRRVCGCAFEITAMSESSVSATSSTFHNAGCFISFAVLVVLYAVSAVYFAGVMVRLMLTLTPCVCILSAIAISKTLDIYLYKEPEKKKKEKSEGEGDSEGDKGGEKKDIYKQVGDWLIVSQDSDWW